MTLNDALADYYSVRRARYEASSWDMHYRRLCKWRSWTTAQTQPNVYLADICTHDSRLVERYFNTLRPPALAPSSFNNARQYVKQFLDYCRTRGWISISPMELVDPLKIKRKVRLRLSGDELLSLLDGATPRDRIGLAIGMNTCLRACDVAALKIGQVNLGDGTITAWIEKTDEEMELPITAELHAELIRWYTHYATELGLTPDRLPNTWTLVPPEQRVSMNPGKTGAKWITKYKPTQKMTNIQGIVHRALQRIDHDAKGEGFHTLRRSGARIIHDMAVSEGRGSAIRVAMVALGHKSQATTEVYLGLSHEKEQLNEMMRGKSFLGTPAQTVNPVTSLEERRSA